MLDISALRRNYTLKSLSESDLCADPIEQFATWFSEALESQVTEPNAMTLATADREGRPSARIVLLKSFDNQGFVFFTNYESQKGKDLAENPQAALLFNWLELQRQIRIEGRVERVSAAESEAYFQSRPKGSQIGAWASPQSRIIPGREVLETAVERLEHEFSATEKLPLPLFWGGFRVLPERIEFWQGRSSRLHDRFLFEKKGANWTVSRLAP